MLQSKSFNKFPTFSCRKISKLAWVLIAFLSWPLSSYAKDTLIIIGHSSFVFPQELKAKFEKQENIDLKIVKAGDTGAMLNKLILSKQNPIADVVFGIDNTFASKAINAEILIPLKPQLRSDKYELPPQLAAVDYAYVTLNYDTQYFANNALPTSLQELAEPQFKNKLVVMHPGTSSPGFAFLLATISHFGEQQAFSWWQQLRNNEVHISHGWSDAYYNHFRQSATKPLVISYSTSPGAEVFYATDKNAPTPTGNLFLDGSSFFQVEGVGILANSKAAKDPTLLAKAEKLIEFLLDVEFQTSLQTTMWVYPVNQQAKKFHEKQSIVTNNIPVAKIEQNRAKWVDQWIKIMLH